MVVEDLQLFVQGLSINFAFLKDTLIAIGLSQYGCGRSPTFRVGIIDKFCVLEGHADSYRTESIWLWKISNFSCRNYRYILRS